ncbi:SLC13 family permease [Kineococcus gynurae]|uniref:SLC13 family permease n=1 Tax=Kineococcus gynurae TaxID=452979 RepID=A0ABV5LQ97_9ACTN
MGEIAAVLLDRAGPVLLFLLAVTVVAELTDRAGVFDAAARLAARAGRGRTWRLWVLVVLLGVLATTFLSLDTTAVLLTPVVLSLAVQLRLDPLPFAMTTVWLANTASLLLPVSNLSNLIALHTMEQLGAPGFTSLTWAPFAAGVLGAVAVLGLAYRRRLRGGYTAPEPGPQRDPVLFWTSAVVCLVLAPLFVAGITPAIPATAAAVLLAVVFAVRGDREVLRFSLLPWKTVLLVAALFVLVEVARRAGMDALLGPVAGSGEGFGAHLRLATTSAVAANLVDNLPAYLAMESVAGSPGRLVAVLIGVNLGPLVTPWASLATLLWLGRCRARGVRIHLGRFAALGLVGAVVCVVAATAALQLTV